MAYAQAQIFSSFMWGRDIDVLTHDGCVTDRWLCQVIDLLLVRLKPSAVLLLNQLPQFILIGIVYNDCLIIVYIVYSKNP